MIKKILGNQRETSSDAGPVPHLSLSLSLSLQGGAEVTLSSTTRTDGTNPSVTPEVSVPLLCKCNGIFIIKQGDKTMDEKVWNTLAI